MGPAGGYTSRIGIGSIPRDVARQTWPSFEEAPSPRRSGLLSVIKIQLRQKHGVMLQITAAEGTQPCLHVTVGFYMSSAFQRQPQVRPERMRSSGLGRPLKRGCGGFCCGTRLVRERGMKATPGKTPRSEIQRRCSIPPPETSQLPFRAARARSSSLIRLILPTSTLHRKSYHYSQSAPLIHDIKPLFSIAVSTHSWSESNTILEPPRPKQP